MKTVVINGANGYVASNFINKLLEMNFRVVALVRAGKKHTAKERMIEVLSKINDGVTVDTQNLIVVNYSLLEKDFAIPEEQFSEIFREKVDYFHFAASLKFDLKSRDEIFKTNVDGLENSIKVFLKYADNISRFFFIGTAYSCGKIMDRFEERFYPVEDIPKFRNYYEQSKRYAENVIKKYRDEIGLNGHIIRLSQVVGDNNSGVTNTDYGIFDFAKRICNVAQRYPGKTARIHIDPESTQNLVSIDTIVSYLLRTIELNKVPVIMNFVAKRSVKNIAIIQSISKLLPIKIVPHKNLNFASMNDMERLISAGMSFTGAYIDTNLQFDTKARDSVILSNKSEVNEQTVFKMLEYFIDNLSNNKRNQTIGHAV